MASYWHALSLFQIHFFWLFYESISRSIYPFLLTVSTGALPEDVPRSVRSEKCGLKGSIVGRQNSLVSSSYTFKQHCNSIWWATCVFVALLSKFHNYDIITFLPFSKPWWWQICLHGDRHSFCIWVVLVYKASFCYQVSENTFFTVVEYLTELCHAISSFRAKEVWWQAQDTELSVIATQDITWKLSANWVEKLIEDFSNNASWETRSQI